MGPGFPSRSREEAPSLIHGDFGLHNALFTGNKVSCILDWEYTMFGDPLAERARDKG